LIAPFHADVFDLVMLLPREIRCHLHRLCHVRLCPVRGQLQTDRLVIARSLSCAAAGRRKSAGKSASDAPLRASTGSMRSASLRGGWTARTARSRSVGAL